MPRSRQPDIEPARRERGKVEVQLEVPEPRALIALAEALGELAADLWLEGKLEIPEVATGTGAEAA